MKVHGKSPPPSGSGYESDDSTTTTGTSASNSNIPSSTTQIPNNQGQTNINVSRECSLNTTPLPVTPTAGVTSHNNTNNHAANLSEWYVCQSAAGMPTPPSNEHSPIPPIPGSILAPSAVY